MSNGIARNNLNDISKIYLDTISDINKKEQADDVKRWQQEEAGCDTTSKSPFRKKKVKAYKEAFSNWRKDLREVTSDAEAQEIDDQPQIKEKKVKNKIKINPEFKEAVKQMGGELLEVNEVGGDDDKKKEQDAAAAKKSADKEKKLKLRILRVKMMAAKSDSGASITAGYEPDLDGAAEYFYEEGINEEGLEQLVEDIGLDAFMEFIEGGTVELNEERAARRASVRAKKYDVVKKEVDKADAARKASKKGEYSAAYKKKETDVTVYDDKVSKKTTVKKVTPKKAAPVKKAAAPKKPVTKKVVKAVAKVKKTQPAKKASKPGIRQKIATLYKRGVERHKKAREAGRVPEKRAKEFVSGVKSGVKATVKFAKDVKKVVSEEALEEKAIGAVVKQLARIGAKKAVRVAKDKKVRKAVAKTAKRIGSAGLEGAVSGAEERAREAGHDSTRNIGKKKETKEGFEVQEKVLDKFETSEKERIVKGMKKSSKDLKKRYGKEWKSVMYATATKKAKEAGDTSKSDKRYAYEEVIGERTLSSYIPSDRQGEASAANREYVKAQLKKKEDESTKNRGDLSKRDAGKMARQRLHTKKIMSMGEGNQRDPEQSKKDRTHSKQPDPSKDGFTGIGNMSIKDIMKMNARMKKEKKEVKEDKAFKYVVDKLRKQHGKDAVITKTSKPKPPTEAQKKKAAAERKKRQDADNKAFASRAKKAGYKNPQDYANVVARYGSEDNYKKGRGLGT